MHLLFPIEDCLSGGCWHRPPGTHLLFNRRIADANSHRHDDLQTRELPG
jgi:hypothetical protein